MRRCRLELQEQGNTHISDESPACNMLRGSGLSHKYCAHVFYHSGSQHVSEAAETCLNNMVGKCHNSERNTVPAWNPTRPRQPGQTWQKAAGIRNQDGSFQPREANGDPEWGIPRPRRKSINRAVEEVLAYDEGDEGNDDSTIDTASMTEQADLEQGVVEEEEEQDEYRDGASSQDAGEEGELGEPPVEVKAAFVQGWRAKSKAAGVKQKRGFLPPKQRPQGPGQTRAVSPAGRRGQDVRKPVAAASAGGARLRRVTSKCADCQRVGHWKGDPEWPKVKAGVTPPFVKTKQAFAVSIWLANPYISCMALQFVVSEEENPSMGKRSSSLREPRSRSCGVPRGRRS